MSTITHINPEALHTNPAFSQATLAETGRTPSDATLEEMEALWQEAKRKD